MKLKVGSSYITEDNKIVTIEGKYDFGDYPFYGVIDGCCEEWRENGRFDIFDPCSSYDLVEEVKPYLKLINND